MKEEIKAAIMKAAEKSKRLEKRGNAFYFTASDDTIRQKLDMYSDAGESFRHAAERIAESAEDYDAELIADSLCEDATEYLNTEDSRFFDTEKKMRKKQSSGSLTSLLKLTPRLIIRQLNRH